MTLVVLGWDALDAELLEMYELTDAFGSAATEIDTFDNPILEKPHTNEVWPSIVTGRPPAETGIRALSADEGTEWENPLVDAITDIGSSFVPDSMQQDVGRLLTNLGVERESKTAAYYDEQGLETLFDGRRSLSLAVPNHQTAADRDLGLAFDRGAQLSGYLSIEEGDDGETHEPTVPINRLDEVVAGQAGKKIGVVRQAVQRQYDVVFAWLGYLDTIGHIAPVVEEAGYQRRHYEQAARWTNEIATQIGEGDTLVCVSDHGLQGGDHTHAATLASDDPGIVERVDSVLDVKDTLDDVAPSRDASEPDVSDRHRYEGATAERSATDVRDQLQDLGYL